MKTNIVFLISNKNMNKIKVYKLNKGNKMSIKINMDASSHKIMHWCAATTRVSQQQQQIINFASTQQYQILTKFNHKQLYSLLESYKYILNE